MADFTFSLEGKRLLDGRFEVGERITVGGMGAVYSATDHNLDLQVVVKVPHLHYLGEPGFVERFKQEIEGLIRLRHPRIVRILAQGTFEEVPFFVLEHLEGGSLQDRLPDGGGRQTADEALSWLEPIASALDFIHEMGVIHRDLKPANILFDGTGNAFLADFGVAKILEGQTSGVTMTGVAVGSPAYMAPEQARGDKVTSASDQYALASTVYEALSGTLPFVGERAITLRRKVREEAPPLGDLVADVPEPVAAAVMRALKRDPADRFDSCGAFASAFTTGVHAPHDAAIPNGGVRGGGGHRAVVDAVRLPGEWVGVSQRPCGGLSPIWEAREPRTSRQRTVCVLAPGVASYPAASRRVPKGGYASVPRWQSAPADLGGNRVLLTTMTLRGDALRLPGRDREHDLADVLAVGRALLELHSIDVAVGLLSPRGILLDRVPDGPRVTFVDMGMDCRAPPHAGAERPAPWDFAWWAPEQVARIHRREPMGSEAWRSDVYFVALAALTAIRGAFPWEPEAFESPRVHSERLGDAIQGIDVSEALRGVLRDALGPSGRRPTLVDLLRAFEGGGAAAHADERAAEVPLDAHARPEPEPSPSAADATPEASDIEEEPPPTDEEIVEYVAAQVDARAAERSAQTAEIPAEPVAEPIPPAPDVAEPAPDDRPTPSPPSRKRDRRAKPTPPPEGAPVGTARLARVSVWVVVGAATAGLLAVLAGALAPSADWSVLRGRKLALEAELPALKGRDVDRAHYYWVAWGHWLEDFETLRHVLATPRRADARSFAAEMRKRFEEWINLHGVHRRELGERSRGPLDGTRLVRVRRLRHEVLDAHLRAKMHAAHAPPDLLAWEEPAASRLEAVVPTEDELEVILRLTEATADAFAGPRPDENESDWHKRVDDAFTELYPLLEAKIAHREWLRREGHDAKRVAILGGEIQRERKATVDRLRDSLQPLAHERRSWLESYVP